MEIINNLIPEGQAGINVMVIINTLMLMIAFPLSVVILKIVYGLYKADQKTIDQLQLKSIMHDNTIESMLKEIKANREADNKQADTTRKILYFVAKKSKIEIPEFE